MSLFQESKLISKNNFQYKLPPPKPYTAMHKNVIFSKSPDGPILTFGINCFNGSDLKLCSMSWLNLVPGLSFLLHSGERLDSVIQMAEERLAVINLQMIKHPASIHHYWSAGSSSLLAFSLSTPPDSITKVTQTTHSNQLNTTRKCNICKKTDTTEAT